MDRQWTGSGQVETLPVLPVITGLFAGSSSAQRCMLEDAASRRNTFETRTLVRSLDSSRELDVASIRFGTGELESIDLAENGSPDRHDPGR